MTLPDTRLGKLREGWRRFKRDGNPGDFAVLKADAFSSEPSAEVAEKLAQFAGLPPEIDLAALARLSDDTFGSAYARFMTENALKPFTVSADLAPIAARNVMAVRYATTHDMFHVLLGFDTSWAGEMGVLSFAASQNYHRQFRIGRAIATVLYPILSPLTLRSIMRAKRRGSALGRQGVFLLAVPLETFWETPLVSLRQQLKLAGS